MISNVRSTDYVPKYHVEGITSPSMLTELPIQSIMKLRSKIHNIGNASVAPIRGASSTISHTSTTSSLSLGCLGEHTIYLSWSALRVNYNAKVFTRSATNFNSNYSQCVNHGGPPTMVFSFPPLHNPALASPCWFTWVLRLLCFGYHPLKCMSYVGVESCTGLLTVSIYRYATVQGI